MLKYRVVTKHVRDGKPLYDVDEVAGHWDNVPEARSLQKIAEESRKDVKSDICTAEVWELQLDRDGYTHDWEVEEADLADVGTLIWSVSSHRVHVQTRRLGITLNEVAIVESIAKAINHARVSPRHHRDTTSVLTASLLVALDKAMIPHDVIVDLDQQGMDTICEEPLGGLQELCLRRGLSLEVVQSQPDGGDAC